MMKSIDLILQSSLTSTYPGFHIGILQFSIEDKRVDVESLNTAIEQIINGMKIQYQEPSSLKADPVIQAHVNYYKSFKKTYHVLPQIESVIYKDKPLRVPFPLLQIIFISELKNRLLTAIHDSNVLKFPLIADVASGDENYTMLNGSPVTQKHGDMFISDQSGVISSILYDPDHRTRISPDTENFLQRFMVLLV